MGVVRRVSTSNLQRIEDYLGDENLTMESGDVTDFSSMDRIIGQYKPDYILNCAASSHVGESFKTPLANLDITGKGCANVLEAMRKNMGEDYQPRFAQWSSSEMFGSNFSFGKEPHYSRIEYSADTEHGRAVLDKRPDDCYQDENTPLSANSPYAAAKIYAHNMTELYRKTYGMFCNSMICWNFEGPDRGKNFVTRKITRYIGDLARWADENFINLNNPISAIGNDNFVRFYIDESQSYIGAYPKLRLGNIKAYRDWSYAGDTADAILLSLSRPTADTYAVCSGNTFSVEDFLNKAFGAVGLDYRKFYMIDPEFFRPCEVPYLRGCSDKIQRIGWNQWTSFGDLVKMMVKSDLPQHSKYLEVKI